MSQKLITQIQVGVIEDKVGWVFEFANAPQESFSLHLGVARQFMQGLQEVVLLLEHQQAAAFQGIHDATGVHETITVRLA